MSSARLNPISINTVTELLMEVMDLRIITSASLMHNWMDGKEEGQ
jgi:hypothetical protein